MKYKDYIDINETFQYSINLQFDINNIEKIKSYIPTSDSCEIINCYLDSILGKFSKSTTLIGPYGKGKSHLLLVLLTLLNNYNDEDKESIDLLLKRIKEVSETTYERINTIRKSNLKYMPVIINSNYNNISQAFLIAMTEALEREKISDIVINTYFDVALKVIEKWEKEGYEDAIAKFGKCLLENNTTIKELKNNLKMYDDKSYNIFKEVYKCVMHGMEFYPLINTDIIKYYKDINYNLCQRGYNGIIIVFDEFSKFLEYVGNESIMKDLKLLQDFAELASRTGKKEQILFSCITHKTINEYIKNLKEDKVNAFKTVEGRFKEIYFNRSMEQNYEMISQTLNKKEGYESFIEKEYESRIAFYNKIMDTFEFCKFDNCEKILFKGAYPLNPLTTFSVVKLSEKVAQNERTLFTFLTDDDINSFKYFINNEKNNGLFNIDKIYDYFKNTFKKDTDQTIKEIWLKAESSILKANNENEVKVIKAIAIIYMIGDFDNFIPNEKEIALALNQDENIINAVIKQLIEKGILKQKRTNKFYDFSSMYTKETTKEIDNIVDSKFFNIDYKSTLQKVYDMGYVIPRRYNQEYKMTRFFKNIYLTDEELNNLKSFKIIKNSINADGIVINLIRKNDDIKKSVERVLELDDSEVIVKIPTKKVDEDVFMALKEYEAIEYLIKTQNNDNEIQKELQLIQEENIELLQNYIENTFFRDNIEYLLCGKDNKKNQKVNALVSDICEKEYNKTPIINNEMINKNEISVPISKAREAVIDTILNDDASMIKSQTSPEATIYRAFYEKRDNLDCKEVIEIVKKSIRESEKNGKESFEKIVQKLRNKPYGVRNGVIPLFLSLAIKEYSDNMVLYYQNKEIDINGSNIAKIIEEPEKYYVAVEKGTKEKEEFVKRMMTLYQVKNTNNYRNNIKNIVIEMKRWALSLPKITREISEVNDIVDDNGFIKIKNELMKSDTNTNELLFIETKNLLESDNYKIIAEKLEKMKFIFDNYVSKYTDNLITDFKENFEHNSKTNLNILLNNWYNDIDDKVKNSIVKIETKKLFEYIKNMNTYNEKEIIENISISIEGNYIEDWQDDSYNSFMNSFNNINEEIKLSSVDAEEKKEEIYISNGNYEIKKYIDNSDISLLGSTLKNNIEDSLEEYGDSVSESEKIKILLELIKKYM